MGWYRNWGGRRDRPRQVIARQRHAIAEMARRQLDLRAQIEEQAERHEAVRGVLNLTARQRDSLARRCSVRFEETERLQRELAEANATISGLGLANAELEKALEHRQFQAEDHAHARRMDGEADHL